MRPGGVPRPLAALDGGLRRVENLAAAIGGVAIAATMASVSADAILRHVFSAPLTFQFHLTESYLMVIGLMLALPWGYRSGGRIQIGLLMDRAPPLLREIVLRAGYLAGAAYLATLGWRAFAVTYEAFAKDERILGVIDWPVGWSWVWVPVGCGLLAARLVVDAALPLAAPSDLHDDGHD